MEEPQPFPVTDLIRDNLGDKLARHLMLITSGDSAMGILHLTFQNLMKEKITIFGSKFEEVRANYIFYKIVFVTVLIQRQFLQGFSFSLVRQHFKIEEETIKFINPLALNEKLS